VHAYPPVLQKRWQSSTVRLGGQPLRRTLPGYAVLFLSSFPLELPQPLRGREQEDFVERGRQLHCQGFGPFLCASQGSVRAVQDHNTRRDREPSWRTPTRQD